MDTKMGQTAGEPHRVWATPIKTALTFLVLTLVVWLPVVFVTPFALYDDPRADTPWTDWLACNIFGYPAYIVVGAALAFALRYRQSRSAPVVVWSPVFVFFAINVGLVILAVRYSATEGLSRDEFAFFHACGAGDLDAVVRGLEGGIDPNRRDRRGKTPITIAIRNKQPEVLRVLLEHGADANQAYENGTFTVVPDPDLLHLFLSHGLDPNRGAALHFAVQRGYVEAVKTLVAHGADPSRRDSDREDALSLAIRLEKWDVAIVLAQTCPAKILERAEEMLVAGPKTDHPRRATLERTIELCMAGSQRPE